MRRNSFAVLLLLAILVSISLTPQAFSKEAGPAASLVGTWKITHRPVDANGKPCPFLPDSIEVFADQTLVMSNIPGAHLPFKTELTAAEMKVLEQKYEGIKGNSLLLVKPNPKMEWTTTPMVYLYSVTKDGLTLTAQGWEEATFKRVK